MDNRWRGAVHLIGVVFGGLGGVLAFCLWCQGEAPVSASLGADIMPASVLIISALHRGLPGFGGQDEAFRVTNVSTVSLVVTDSWRVRDDDGDIIAFPMAGFAVAVGESVWCARNALSFTVAFGFSPDLEYGTNSTNDVADMILDAGFNLADDGGSLTLFRIARTDTANGDGGPWPSGSGVSTDRRSMERIDPTAPDDDGNWGTSLSTTIGLDAVGQPISGTPRYTNSLYSSAQPTSSSSVVINEVAWAGTGANSFDEWIELHNVTDRHLDLDGWLLAAVDGTPSIWLSGRIEGHGFYLLERTDDSTVSNVEADQIYVGALVNTGEALELYRSTVLDAVVYGTADPVRAGWVGPAVQPYTNGSLATAGQILFRGRDESSGTLVPDTDMATDWANAAGPSGVLYGPVREGDVRGKRVMYPGWDWDAYTGTFEISATAWLTVGIAPDNAYTVTANLLSSAQETILIEAYTFESVWLTQILTERLSAGVQVTMLLEGAPAGGLPDQELWNCQQLADAGAKVYFMHDDAGASVHARYASQHAKYVVVDSRWVGISTENFGNHGMPVDDKSNGTAGDRGVVLVIDQAEVARYVEMLYALDCDPAHHLDVVGYGELNKYTVSPTYTAIYSTGGGGYEYMAPFSGTVPAVVADHFEVVHAPETVLRYSEGLIGLVLRAGLGDEVYVEQLYERVRWGPAAGGVLSDPNPRLEAYLQAARNGARVRILLDNGLDDRRQNYDTAFYLQQVAGKEGLDLEVRLGAPTGRAIHNKMVLLHLGGEGYTHVGSLNGSEVSSKANRELAVQVRSIDLYATLKRVFDHDWAHSSGPYEVYLPMLLFEYVSQSSHVLISEVQFKQDGEAEWGEWVEIYNPTSAAVDVGGWLLGDAAHEDDYERLHAFPKGTTIPPEGVFVIARRAEAYQSLDYPNKSVPDFELVESNSVPNMIRVPWGTGEFALGNAGDEVLLFSSFSRVVDALVYGDGSYPGVVSYGDVSGVYNGHSLERWPANRDSDECPRDFRVRYVPDPGNVVAQ